MLSRSIYLCVFWTFLSALSLSAGQKASGNENDLTVDTFGNSLISLATADDVASVYVNFTNATNSSDGDYWNDLTSIAVNATNVLSDLVDSDGTATSIALKPFRLFSTTINTNGEAVTNTTLNMPSIVSSTAFYGYKDDADQRSVARGGIVISGLEHKQLYDFTVFASCAGTEANYETQYTFTGSNQKTGSLNPYNNTDNLAVVEGIQPGRDGRVYLEVTYGPNNTSTDKSYFIGAMAITPGAVTAEVPYNSPWNGYTIEEPAAVSSVYQITSGAELAWYAARVNGIVTDGGARHTNPACILIENIDLGGYEWTPIADGRYYPPNGTTYPYYSGTFDGNFKKITGLKMSATEEFMGFIGSGNACDVKNVHIAGEMVVTATVASTSNGRAIGTLTAYATQSGVYTNCLSEVDIKMNTSAILRNGVGAIVGYFNSGTISNCSYSGTCTSEYGLTVNGLYGTINTGTNVKTYPNNHYLSGTYITGAEEGKITPHTAQEYYSGEVAYLMQKEMATQTFGQMLDGQMQTFPIFSTDGTYKVYEAEIYSGTSTPESAYANEDGLPAKGENVMVYIDEEIDLNKISDNVVVKSGSDYVANNIVLTDGFNFYIPATPSVTASSASYSRECFTDGTPETIILPFVPTSVTSLGSSAELSIAAYDSISYTTNSVNFIPQATWTANTPYLLYVENAIGDESKYIYSFEADNVVLNAAGVNGIFSGVYQTTGLSADDYLVNTDNSLFVAAGSSCPAFQGYLHFSTDPNHSLIITYNKGEDVPTGIEEIKDNKIQDFQIYGIDGRIIKTVYQTTREAALYSLPRGIYVVNGEKVFKITID